MVLVTNKGKELVMNRTFISSPTYTAPTRFQVGTGTTTVVLADTDLETPVPIQTTEIVDDCETADWSDSADLTTSLNTTTWKENTSSLDLTKDGTGGDVIEANKATFVLDFTSKEFSMWLYIKDATMLAKLASTACLEVRYGSSAGNYYYWTRDLADLAVGWNLIDGLTSATASTTGTPSITVCDYTMIKMKSDAAGTTWSAGDLAMDDLKLISSDDYYKNIEAGYPVMDYTAHEVTVQCRINTVQANGYPLTEIGVFNTDSPDILMSRALFSTIGKTQSEEIIFDVIYEIV